MDARGADVVPARQLPQHGRRSVERIPHEPHARAAPASRTGEEDGSVLGHGGRVLPPGRVGDRPPHAVGDVVAHDVALAGGPALVPHGVVPVHLAGREEGPLASHLVEASSGVRREIEQDDPSGAAPVQASKQQPTPRKARPVLPLICVHAAGWIAAPLARKIEELQIGGATLELLVHKPVAIDISIGSVRTSSVHLELLASPERASVDVIVTGVRTSVLLPRDERVPLDRLVLTGAGPTQEQARSSGACLPHRRPLEKGEQDRHGAQEGGGAP